MKTLLQTFFVLAALLTGTASAESLFTKEQAIDLGRLILAAPENKEYKDIFWDDIPEYDPKTKLWAYKNGWPRTPGGTFYTFEIKGADGFSDSRGRPEGRHHGATNASASNHQYERSLRIS